MPSWRRGNSGRGRARSRHGSHRDDSHETPVLALGFHLSCRCYALSPSTPGDSARFTHVVTRRGASQGQTGSPQQATARPAANSTTAVTTRRS
jgi:hypothetical protein